MGRRGAASADGRGGDGSPGCSGDQAEWGCHPELSYSRWAQGHVRCLASSYGIPAKRPGVVGGGGLLNPAMEGLTHTEGLTHSFMSFTLMLGC